MKNLFLLLVVVTIATTSFGQIRVITTGETIVGDNVGVVPNAQLHVSGGMTSQTTGESSTILVNRTDGSAMLFGAGVGAGFTFDNATNMTIRSNNRANIEDRLLTTGAISLFIEGATNRVGIRNQNPTASLHVLGNTFTSGSYQGSDKALKNNIQTLDYGLNEILALNTITYNYRPEMGFDDDNIKFGVVAQELQKVMPELVSTFAHETYDVNGVGNGDVKDYLMIDNGALQYVLVNAIKDQQELLDAQAEKIAQLEEVVNTIGSTESPNRTQVTLTGYDLAELGQNTPNPFNGNTSISYVIPTNAKTAQIAIYGTNGSLLKTLDIDHVGTGTLEVNASELPTGTYTYQLVVDGKSIKTNKMVSAR